MASGSGSSQGSDDEDEESLKKLLVRLNNVQEGKQIETLVQILEDLLVFTYSERGKPPARHSATVPAKFAPAQTQLRPGSCALWLALARPAPVHVLPR